MVLKIVSRLSGDLRTHKGFIGSPMVTAEHLYISLRLLLFQYYTLALLGFMALGDVNG
jgi:hypothetical protein